MIVNRILEVGTWKENKSKSQTILFWFPATSSRRSTTTLVALRGSPSVVIEMTNQIPRDFLHIRCCWCAPTICTELEMHCIWHFSQVDCVSGKCNPDQTWEGFFGARHCTQSVPCSVLQSWEIMPCVLHTLCNVRSSLKSAHCRGYFSLPDVLSWGAEQDLLSDHWAERSFTLLLFVTIAQNSFAPYLHSYTAFCHE